MQNPFSPPPGGASSPVPVQKYQGRYFHCALPAGWQVQENSNLICLTSPDGAASILAAGLVGLLQQFTPDQFMYYLLNLHQMQIIHVFQGERMQAAPGCTEAGRFEILYVTNSVAARGIATCQVATGYNQCNGSLILAASRQEVWEQYHAWLPEVAAQVTPAGPHTYMASLVAENDRRATHEFGQRLQETNEYIHNLHQQTVNERWASQDRQNFHFRENLGAVATYYNPYENQHVEIPTQYTYYWVNRQGRVYGTDDPREDPRVGSTDEWSQDGEGTALNRTSGYSKKQAKNPGSSPVALTTSS